MVDVNEDDLTLRKPDRTDPTALHDQVAAAIRRAIADGEAHPGDRIPQAKDLAVELGVNKNTVLRALRTLREEGILEMGRGRAIRVTASADQSTLTTKAQDLLDYARHQGYQPNELVHLIQRLA
ncbi:MAG TPA: GntR family transcriptional regulator [Solirubrobacteraceae bacterium]